MKCKLDLWTIDGNFVNFDNSIGRGFQFVKFRDRSKQTEAQSTA
jgi:hypothetical protein